MAFGWMATVAVLALCGNGAPGIGDAYYPDFGNGGIDVQSYDLAIDVDPVKNELTGTATLELRTTEALERFDLDFFELDIDELTVAGSPATFTRAGRELVITPKAPLAAGAAATVVVRYHGDPEPVPDPSVPIEGVGWLWHGRTSWVLSEPGGAANFFPCSDHPSDKATFVFHVTVPAPYSVVANGTLTATAKAKIGTTYTWTSKEPMATYVATICIAEFDEKRLPLAGNREVVLHFPKGTPEKKYRGLLATGPIVEFFETKFGPYPFDTVGGVLSDLAIPAALETQTRPIYGFPTGGSESIVAHEMAHQWFGNSVSVARWQDIFLAEGFAEYSAWLWAEHKHGRAAYDTEVKQAAAVARGGHSAPSGDPGVKQLFGVPSYQRGPLVLHALRTKVGDDAFFDLLRAWCDAKKHGNATVDEFIDFASTHSQDKQAVRDLLHAWLFDKDVPADP